MTGQRNARRVRLVTTNQTLEREIATPRAQLLQVQRIIEFPLALLLQTPCLLLAQLRELPDITRWYRQHVLLLQTRCSPRAQLEATAPTECTSTYVL